MSFGCNLYTFSKRVNSTARPTLEVGEHFEIDVKEPFSIMSPQLVFSFEPGYNPTSFNYAYIAQWQRRYYVEDWTNERGQWVASCKLDVLGSWKTYIGSTALYVLRASNASDGALIDTLYPASTSDILETVSGRDLFVDNLSDGWYIVGIIGDNTDGGGAVTYYALKEQQFNEIINNLLSSVDWMNISSIDKQLQRAIINPMQFFASVNYLPCDYPGGEFVSSISLGWWTNLFSNDQGQAIAKKINGFSPVFTLTDRFTFSDHPQISRGSYLNFPPYCNMWLDFQPFGLIPIDVSQVRAGGNHTLMCIVDIDVISGVASLRLVSGAPGSVGIIDHVQAKVECSIPLAQISTDMIGALGSAAGAVGQASAGNWLGAGIGLASAIGQGGIPKVGQTGSYSGALSLNKGTPQLVTQYYAVADEDNEHNGRPLCKVRTPASLGGYMRVERGDVAAPATSAELQEIKSYLEGGFYYE